MPAPAPFFLRSFDVNVNTHRGYPRAHVEARRANQRAAAAAFGRERDACAPALEQHARRSRRFRASHRPRHRCTAPPLPSQPRRARHTAGTFFDQGRSQMTMQSSMPPIGPRGAAAYRRYDRQDRQDDLERTQQELANRERRLRDFEQQLQARSDAISDREAAQSCAEGIALQEHVDARLSEGRRALGLDDRSSSRPFRNDMTSAHDGSCAAMILAAGEARRNPPAPPLPTDRTARAIVLSGMLRRAEITDQQYAALLNGGGTK